MTKLNKVKKEITILSDLYNELADLKGHRVMAEHPMVDMIIENLYGIISSKHIQHNEIAKNMEQ